MEKEAAAEGRPSHTEVSNDEKGSDVTGNGNFEPNALTAQSKGRIANGVTKGRVCHLNGTVGV